MKTLIPTIEEALDSDESGDEIPPGGVLGLGMVDAGEEEEQEGEGEGEGGSEGSSHSDDSNSPLHDNGTEPQNDDLLSSSSEDLNEATGRGEDSDSDSSSCEENTSLTDLFGVKPSIEANRDHPPNIKVESMVMDVCFHPQAELLSMATISGEVMIHRYSQESTEEVSRLSHHKESCRSLCYSEDGSLLYTVSKDKSLAIIDTESSAVRQQLWGAHEAAVHTLFPVDENLCATGDDGGVVKLWDLRKKKPIFKYSCGEEMVTALLADEGKKTLVASLGDGSISAFDMRKKTLVIQSEMYESELTSLTVVRNGSRLVVGSGEGTLFIFKWGEFAHHIDRFPGHPGMVNCVIPITDTFMLTGCEDGNIRAVQLYSHRFAGVVGQHNDFGVDNMSVSHDGSLLASCSAEEVVHFWNIDYLYDIDVEKSKKGSKKRKRNYHLPSSKRRNRCDFFTDIPEKMDSDDEAGPVAGPSHTMD